MRIDPHQRPVAIGVAIESAEQARLDVVGDRTCIATDLAVACIVLPANIGHGSRMIGRPVYSRDPIISIQILVSADRARRGPFKEATLTANEANCPMHARRPARVRIKGRRK